MIALDQKSHRMMEEWRTQLVRILVLVLQVSVLSVLQVLAAAGYTAVLILRDGILILNLGTSQSHICPYELISRYHYAGQMTSATP